jgi:hypothetical protein
MDRKRIPTQEELQYIFDFCKKWDVVYVDLRLELVDHIASQISEIWEQSPEVPFKEAFHRVYKSFGIFGLLNIVETHRKIMYRKYWQELKSGLIKWVTPPKILLVLLMFFCCYSIISWAPSLAIWFYAAMWMALILAAVFLIIRARKLSKVINREQTMLIATPKAFFWLIYIFYFIPMQQGFTWIFPEDPTGPHWVVSQYGPLVVSFLCVLTGLLIAIHVKILSLAQQQLDVLSSQLTIFNKPVGS